VLELDKIYNMDCLDGMKQIDDNYIDTIITDPPYGLSFMGKKWDYDVPSISIWKECLRVLKPGGTLLCFAGSRTQHRMAVNVEDAGFILKDCIMWLYGSGFPKASDISKQLDKVVGKQSKGFVTAGDDGRKAEFKQDKSFRSDCGYKWKPEGEEAKLWDGWKSHGLKPAYEPILVAMKPNDGSYANNALVWGVSGLNIDGGRIPVDPNLDDMLRTVDRKQRKSKTWENGSGFKNENNRLTGVRPQGRYPANVIIDEESAKMLDEQSGVSKSSKVGFKGIGWKHSGNTKDEMTDLRYQQDFDDKGGASRFFYCAKASKTERNAGCNELKEKDSFHGSYKGRDLSNQKAHLGGLQSGKPTNHHPTVKPLKLMEYLCKLTTTPTGGIVLDPFIGSGTTALACKKTGRKFIGFENNNEYVEIANKRLSTIPNRLENWDER